MTAQISDKIMYKNDEYSIVALENKLPFNPEDHGFNPVMIHTACYRGYYCQYALKDKQFVLDNLTINQEDELPVWRGVEPEEKSRDGWVYENINLPIAYSGGIVMGREFIDEFYVHMGFQRAHCYERVLELELAEGNLVDLTDHSEKMKEIRKEFREKGMPKKEIVKFINDAFSLSYGEKKF